MISISRINDDLLKLEDGYVYYFPKTTGALSSHNLRQIADILDEKNAEWDAIVQSDTIFNGE